MSYTPTPPLRMMDDQSGAMLGERNMELTADVVFIYRGEKIPCVYSSINIRLEPLPDGTTRVTQFTGFRGDYPPFRGADLAAVPHDGIYGDAEKIAATFGWSLEHVLDYANEMFDARMHDLGASPAIREVCYQLVCLAGYPYHEEKELGFWRWAAMLIGGRLSTPSPKIGAEP